jgi:hypothetical protein
VDVVDAPDEDPAVPVKETEPVGPGSDPKKGNGTSRAKSRVNAEQASEDDDDEPQATMSTKNGKATTRRKKSAQALIAH